jgi:hypothetical protein
MKKTTTVLLFVGLFFALPDAFLTAENVWFPEGEKLWRFVDGGMVDAGTLIFTDDFDKKMSGEWKPDGAHVWKAEDGILATTGYGGGNLLKKEPGENFLVEVRVKPIAEDPERKGGFAGISVSGILFTLQSGRWWWQYKREGETKGVGGWKTEPVEFNRWYNFRIVRQGSIFEWFVDDRKICSIVESGMKGGLRLHSWRIKTAYDSVKVYRIEGIDKTGALSGTVNLVRNSSFEDSSDENMPIHWCPSGALNIPLVFGDMETFWNSYTVDRAVGYQGKDSLRVKGGDKGNSLLSHWLNTRKGKSYTVSLYMKSGVDKMPVDIFIQGIKDCRKQVETGRDWKRYLLSIPDMSLSRVRIGISPRAEGFLWVDAVQMEEGTEATDYKMNPLDVKTTVETGEPELPQYIIHRVDKPPVVDGKIEDAAWNKDTAIPPLKVPGTFPGQYFEPLEKTEGYICHDADNLYLAFRCMNSGSVEVKNEEIEIFIDTNLDRKTYYRFIVNPAGRVSEDRTLDTSWNGEWIAKTEVRKGLWTVETAIPLSSLALSHLTPDSWGINVGRTNRKTEEGSHIALTTNKGMYYHQAGRYPVFRWEEPGVFAKHIQVVEQTDEEKTSSIRVFADRSYYTTETRARIHTKAGSDIKPSNLIKIEWQLNKGGVAVKKGNKKVRGETGVIEVPLTGLSHGVYEFSARFLNGAGDEVASAKEVIRKMEPAENEVKIDRVRRVLLVDGKPFFAFMPLQLFHIPAGHPYGNQDEVIDTQMAWWKQHGFRTLHIGVNADMEWSERIWDRVFESAEKNNLKVVVFWTGRWYRVLIDNPEKLERFITRWKDKPSLLAWMPADEPEIGSVKPEDVAAGIKRVKEMDPYHPVYINYTQIGPVSRYAGLPGDIMSLDYYLTAVEGRTIEETLRFVDIMEEISEEQRTPTWNYIAGSTIFNHCREISAEEQVAQTYGNVIKGASGLGYFFGQILGRRHWKAFRNLNEEMTALTPIIFSGEEIKQVAVSSKDILYMTRKYGDRIHIMAVNIHNRKVDAAFDLSLLGKTGEAGVIFENRNLRVERGLLKDTFLPFERHVYKIYLR